MKKIFVLASVVAAIVGARKLFGSREMQHDDEYPYSPPAGIGTDPQTEV